MYPSINLQAWMILAPAFLTIFLFCIGVSQFVRQQKSRRELIGKIRHDGDKKFSSVEEVLPGSEEKTQKSLLSRLFGKLGKFAAAKKDEIPQTYSGSRLKFLKAGIRTENAQSVFWGAKLFLIFLIPCAFIVLRITLFQLMTYQMSILFGVLSALLGFYLPDIWLRQKTDKRKEKILLGLPDALDLLVICVEAGMGLDSAISRVSKELKMSSPELSDELYFMTLELRAGKERQEALRNLALRTNLEEINSLSTLLIQTDKFGTSMADALRIYSDTFRSQRFQRAEEMAAKLPVKLVFPLILFIFPSLFVVLLGPAAITIYNNILTRF
jgi:tight adherence protein C